MNESQLQRLVHEQDGSVCILFDLTVHSETAIKKSVYKFAADFSVVLERTASNDMAVLVNFPASTNEDSRSSLVRALCNEVIDQDLREQIATETEATRNLILAQAFSKTNLISEE